MHRKLLLTFVLAYTLLQGAVGQTELTISLFATDLNGCDDLSPCDAFVKIMCQSTLSDWKLCGETKELQDDNFPLWTERFTFQYIPSQSPRWRFDVIDSDVFFNDPIGSATVTVEAFINATEIQPTMKFDLNGRGSFYVHRRTS